MKNKEEITFEEMVRVEEPLQRMSYGPHRAQTTSI